MSLLNVPGKMGSPYAIGATKNTAKVKNTKIFENFFIPPPFEIHWKADLISNAKVKRA